MGRSDGTVDARADGADGGGSAAATALERTGIDAVALKPTEHDLSKVSRLSVSTVAVDYEGRSNLPETGRLRSIADGRELVVTTPVRADGFDPLGDRSLVRSWLPERARRAVVAGHPAYLTDEERERSVADRVGAALRESEDAWVGTEGIERVALATGRAQYELLSRGTERELRALRTAGFDGGLVVYAPAVLTDDEDEILDAVGAYVARRGPVAAALPDGSATDAAAAGRAREVLSAAARDYALVGSVESVRERVAELRSAGADTVVAYPARGIDAVAR